MANICLNYITINSEDRDNMQRLADFFDGSETRLVHFCEKAELDKESYYLRANVSYVEYQEDDDQLLINVDSAWTPALKLIRDIAEKYVPDCEIVYNSQECGNVIYYTNDPMYFGTYCVDVCDWDALPIKIESIDDMRAECVVGFLNELFNTEEKDIDKLLEMLRNSEYDRAVKINPWEERDIDEAEG